MIYLYEKHKNFYCFCHKNIAYPSSCGDKKSTISADIARQFVLQINKHLLNALVVKSEESLTNVHT